MYVTMSDVRDGVAKTYAVVSEVQHGAADTHVVVADIHAMVSEIRKMLGSQEGADGQRQWVSNTHFTSIIKLILIVFQNQTRSANSITD
jgi:hypothetical protein